MESTPPKQSNLTNKDFRELLKNHVPIKREHPEITTRRGKKEKKVKPKRYDKKKRDDSLEVLLSRYRDRARERREGKNPDYLCAPDNVTDPIAYHTVGPDAEHNIRLAERRRQLIHESKYLGGDMAHTHLVKGLDYALLNKVRSEIEAKTKEVEVEIVVQEDTGFKGQMAKNIHEILFNSTPAVKNPLFAPGKMCYLVDLKEEQIDTDIPTTVIRSQILTIDDDKTMTTTDAIIDKIREVMQGAKEDSKYKKLKKIEPPPERHEQKTEEKKPEIRNTEKVRASKTEEMLKKLIDEPNGYAECYPGAEAMLEAAGDSDCENMPLQLEIASKGAYQLGLKKTAAKKTRQFAKGDMASLDHEWTLIKDRLQL